MTDSHYTFITAEGLERLKEELNDLKKVKRKEIVERIRSAKELGDLSENAEYIEAKESQAFIEGKILEIEHIIKNARVIESKKSSSKDVNVGSTIRVKSDNKEFEYVIVGSNEADPTAGKISHVSPLGKAFLKRKIGDVVTVEIPKGKREFEILTIR